MNTDPAVSRGVVARGARWSFAALATTEVGRIGFSLVLAKIIGPESFGIVGQATVYVALATVFLDLGLGSALIQKPSLSGKDISTGFWLNAGAGVALTAVTLAASPLVAAFFHSDTVGPVLAVMSLTFLFKSLAVVPLALLTRRLNLRTLGAIEVTAVLVGGVAGLVAALNGAEYWSLVIQTLVTDGFYLLGMLLFSRGLTVRGFSFKTAKELTSFGVNLLGAQLMSFAGSNADNLLVGRYLGPEPLANYQLAYRALRLPLLVVGQTVNRLLLPVFSRIQDQPQRCARHYLTAVQALSYVVVPMMGLLALSAPTVIPFVFDESWEPSIAPMQWLSLAGVLAVVSTPMGSLLIASGRPRWEFWWQTLTTAVSIVGFAVGIRWGIAGVAAGFVVVGIPMMPIGIRLIGRLVPITVMAWLRVLLPASTGFVFMGLGWFLATRIDALSGEDLIGLIGAGAVASVGYLIGLAIWPADTRAQWELAMAVIGRRARETEPVA